MQVRGKVAVAVGTLLAVSLVAGVAGAEPVEEPPGTVQQEVSQEQQGGQEVQVQEARSGAVPQGAQEAGPEAASESEGGPAPEGVEAPRQEAEGSEAERPEQETGEEPRSPGGIEPARGDGSVEGARDRPGSPDESAGTDDGEASAAASEQTGQQGRDNGGGGEQPVPESFSAEGSGIPPERAAEIEARIQEVAEQVQELREEAEARRQNTGEPQERPANQGDPSEARSEEERNGTGGPESQPAPPPATNDPAPEGGRGDGPGAGAVEQRDRSGGAERGERSGSSDGRAAPAAAQARQRELQAEARTGELPRPATGGSSANRQRELGIARDRIAARPVDELSLREYEKLYKEAAEEYGFEEDWYILAAVGKVESDHGQNLGPSSAGALGPMQFLPSTWEEFAVDGNDNGRKNIMDPEDAIPGAANYLSESGAPEDWYGALFTYNRADWYVRKVLDVAEGYRQLAQDDSVGPYPRLAPPR